MKRSLTACVLAACVGLGLSVASAAPLGTGFTYQGRLDSAGTPLTGTADVRFRLMDSALGAGQVGATLIATNVTVTNGTFAVQLDFGAAAFDGGERFLEISVRNPSGAGAFTLLSPRQPVTVAPYALQTRGLFTNNALDVGVGTTSPQAKFNVAGNLRIDDGDQAFFKSGKPIGQQLRNGNGLASAYFNSVTGGFVTAVGTSSDDSGFLDIYGADGALIAQVEGDSDGDATNGIQQGLLRVRSSGTGGPGGKISVESNDGTERIRLTGGTTGVNNASLMMMNGATTAGMTLKGDIGGFGGDFRTQDEAGAYQSIVQPDASGGGVFVFLTRDTSADGLTFDGNVNGTGSPKISIFGASPMTFNASATGDTSVVLPNNAISSLEILDEPGVANDHVNSVAMPTSIGVLTQRSITVPGPGFVLALAQGDLQILHSTGTATNCQYGVSASPTSMPGDQDVQTQLPAALSSGTYDFSASAHGLFTVGAAGTFTYYFNGSKLSGANACTMFDIQLTLVYFPTAYGTVVSNVGVGGGPETVMAGDPPPRLPLTPQESANEQANEFIAYRARMDAEMGRMRAQMAEMQSYLEQVKREQGAIRQSVPVVPATSPKSNIAASPKSP